MTLHAITTRPVCLHCRGAMVPGSGSEYCHRPECRHRAERAAEQAKAPIRVADLLAIQEAYAHPLVPHYADLDVPPVHGQSPSQGVHGARVRIGKPPQVEDVLGDLAEYRNERGKVRLFNLSLIAMVGAVMLVIGVWVGRGMW